MDNEQEIFYKRLKLILDKTGWYMDLTDINEDTVPARNLIDYMLCEDCGIPVKEDLKLAQQKIREANLILKDLEYKLAMFD